jgi:hypothetical protein
MFIKYNLFNQLPLTLGRESWDSHGAGPARKETYSWKRNERVTMDLIQYYYDQQDPANGVKRQQNDLDPQARERSEQS